MKYYFSCDIGVNNIFANLIGPVSMIFEFFTTHDSERADLYSLILSVTNMY